MKLNENKKLSKYNNLINIYKNINTKEFNELLLYTFENQCQSYFLSILSNNNDKYRKKKYSTHSKIQMDLDDFVSNPFGSGNYCDDLFISYVFKSLSYESRY